MNNTTQEDYCSNEVRKLLKDKGFDVRIEGIIPLSAVTHSLAIKWIRDNFGPHVQAPFDDGNLKYYYVINSDVNRIHANRINSLPARFDSPEAATEAALLYTLQNLVP